MASVSLKLIFTSAIFLGLLSVSSLACSYADGYLPPTKYDLVKKSDVVVLAQAISKSGNSVNFKVLEVLKGDFRDPEFHGSEEHTSCVEYSYAVEVEHNVPPFLAQKLPKIYPKYVLFLQQTENGWQIWSDAADSMNEIVIDPDSSAFLKTVKHFIRISSANNYEAERKELVQLRQLARTGRSPKEYPKELIRLIDRHLTSPTPDKSYRDLVYLYAHSRNVKKREVLWALAKGNHAEAAKFFTDLLRSPIPLNYIGPISEYITQSKNEALLVKLGRNYPRLAKEVRWPLMWALIKTADQKHHGMMLAALKSADKDEAGRLSEWFVRNPLKEATEIVRALVGNAYQENWELSINLSGMGDIGTLNWAREFMNSEHKDRWMAFYAIANSPLAEADVLAKRVIAGTDTEELVWLIQGYAESHNPNKWSRLRDIVNLKSRDPEVDQWLRRTLQSMADTGDNNSEELLKTLRR